MSFIHHGSFVPSFAFIIKFVVHCTLLLYFYVWKRRRKDHCGKSLLLADTNHNHFIPIPSPMSTSILFTIYSLFTSHVSILWSWPVKNKVQNQNTTTLDSVCSFLTWYFWQSYIYSSRSTPSFPNLCRYNVYHCCICLSPIILHIIIIPCILLIRSVSSL